MCVFCLRARCARATSATCGTGRAKPCTDGAWHSQPSSRSARHGAVRRDPRIHIVLRTEPCVYGAAGGLQGSHHVGLPASSMSKLVVFFAEVEDGQGAVAKPFSLERQFRQGQIQNHLRGRRSEPCAGRARARRTPLGPLACQWANVDSCRRATPLGQLDALQHLPVALCNVQVYPFRLSYHSRETAEVAEVPYKPNPVHPRMPKPADTGAIFIYPNTEQL